MTTLDFALQMEKDGELFYRELAKKASDSGISKILTNLAEMEVQHYEALQSMQDESDIQWKDTFRDDIKSLFGQLQQDPSAFDTNVSEIELYREAQALERKSRDFYAAKAKRVDEGPERDLLKKMAAEEESHELMLQSLIDFLSKPVEGQWLENAEWTHLESY